MWGPRRKWSFVLQAIRRNSSFLLENMNMFFEDATLDQVSPPRTWQAHWRYAWTYLQHNLLGWLRCLFQMGVTPRPHNRSFVSRKRSVVADDCFHHSCVNYPSVRFAGLNHDLVDNWMSPTSLHTKGLDLIIV